MKNAVEYSVCGIAPKEPNDTAWDEIQVEVYAPNGPTSHAEILAVMNAAPDLLEALTMYLDDQGGRATYTAKEIHEKMRAAIAKTKNFVNEGDL